MRPNISHSLLMAFTVFVLNIFMTGNGDLHRNMCYNFSLNKGTVLSYINTDNHKNSLSEDNKTSKNNFVSVIPESRISFSNDNDSFYIDGGSPCSKNFSEALYSYIQNYSCDRVLHPPLEQLGILII